MTPEPMLEEPVFFVHGPKFGDADFCGRWLLAAAKADRLWQAVYNEKRVKTYVDRLVVGYAVDFGAAAAGFVLMQLKQRSFVIFLESPEAEFFAMMTAMGFFRSEGPKHQMAIPSKLTIAGVRAAFLQLAETEDQNRLVHPEYLVATMPFSTAKLYQLMANRRR